MLSASVEKDSFRTETNGRRATVHRLSMALSVRPKTQVQKKLGRDVCLQSLYWGSIDEQIPGTHWPAQHTQQAPGQ